MATAYMTPLQQQQQQQSQQPHSVQGSSFSPLTMFECTISSATMLIDSMAVRDLLVAFKIVAQLHGHLLEVLDPTVQRLANVADEHSMCPPTVVLTTVRNSAAAASTPASGLLSSASVSASALVCSKRSPPGSDDDCVLVEADVRHLLDCQPPSSQHPHHPHHHLSLNPAKMARNSSAEASGVGGSDNGGDLSNEWKATLRKAYRVLKDETGSNVFDFSLPYSAGANTQASQRVIDKALGLSRQRPSNLAAWQNQAGAYVHRWFRCNLKPTAKRAESQLKISATFSKLRSVSNKLNRRQKAYEAIKLELDEDTRRRVEAAVLSREYTSSDEEFGDAPAGDPLDPQTQQQLQLRVRALAWESEELRQLKRQLDEAFAERLAPSDPTQRAEIGRIRREPGVYSTRLAPSDGLDWAKAEYSGGDASVPGGYQHLA